MDIRRSLLEWPVPHRCVPVSGSPCRKLFDCGEAKNGMLEEIEFNLTVAPGDRFVEYSGLLDGTSMVIPITSCKTSANTKVCCKKNVNM